MKISPTGGLALGPVDGPQIDVIPFDFRAPTLERAVASVRKAREWLPPIHFMPPGKAKNITGIQAIAPDIGLTVRFTYPRAMDPGQALAVIEQAEKGQVFPRSLSLGLLVAARAKNPHLIPYCVDLFVEYVDRFEVGQDLRLPPTRAALQDYFPTFLRQPLLPANWGSSDIARFLWQLAAWLWQPEGRRAFMDAGGLNPAAFEWLAVLRHLAAGYANAVQKEEVIIDGKPFQFRCQNATWLWPQLLEFDREHIPAGAVHFLYPTGLAFGGTYIDRSAAEGQQAGHACLLPEDPAATLALTHALIEEAAARKHYVPMEGTAFTLEIPDEYLLRSWNIQALRVYLAKDGLWVAPVDDKGSSDTGFFWKAAVAGPRLGPLVVGQVTPLLDVTMAALWHDLHIGGEEALPGDLRPARQGSEVLSRGRKAFPTGNTTPRAPVKILPGKVYRLQGRRTWGTARERRYIIRMRQMPGKPRRLPPGHKMSKAARERAEAADIVIPPGYTYVKPFTRGSRRAGEEEPVTIRAKGLASVMAWLKAR